jgi:predicted Zn-dependent protease
VTKGLLKQVKNEDELAGVLAHEIAHVGLRHPEIAAQAAAENEGLADMAGEFQALAGLAGGVASYFGKHDVARGAELAKQAAPVLGKVTQGLHETYSRGYDRKEEFKADEVAVDLMSRPGVRYSPEAFRDFIARLPKKKSGAYATHPDLDGRVKAIEEQIQKTGLKIPLDPARTARFKAATAGLNAN